MSIVEMMGRIDREHNEAHERLKSICEKSERLNYDDMIKRLSEVTGDIAGYKFDTFVDMLADELENNKRLNEDDWDFTEAEIMARYDNDVEYWKENYERYGDKDLYKDVEEFKESMIDWMIEYSLDGAFASVEYEYKYRKDQGLC
ncbi:hypothetical protein [Clostridium sp. C8-1-8]|uniref:hypothetical protein n=1 Tax=Clostridium sp. C8-1-8 TaxID=2698831 RepID=UPI00136B7977|nr:hypothetical protein [Clostridium sp. C8-1-8]